MVAPRSGEDTQELLAGKLRGGLEQVASAGKKVRTQVTDLANRGKENVAGAIDDQQRGLPDVPSRGLDTLENDDVKSCRTTKTFV
jgi:hypothetical protein